MTTQSLTSIAARILPVQARVRHALGAFAHGVFLSLAIGQLAGCDETGDGDAADEFRSFTFWETVECDEHGDGCFARHSGSADLWTNVIDACELSAMVTQGTLTPMRADGWDRSTCDPGGVPTEAPDVQCFWIQGGPNSICYAGGDGWYAIARPACEDEYDFSLSAWPVTGSCSTGSFGANGYDSVEASTMASNYALGTIADEAYHLRPTCWLDSNLSMVAAVAGTCFVPEGN